MVKPDNRVEYDIWYSSSNDNSLDFIQDFMKVDKRFGDKVLMTPRVVWWECLDCDREFKDKFCYGNGKYCSLESEDSNLSGREMLMEDLRQLCIYQFAYNQNGKRNMFWDYVKEVH